MDNIEASLVKTIAGSDLSSITLDATELGLDSILDEGLFKDIPVLSTIRGLVKTSGTIRDCLYLKKVYRFLDVLERNSNSGAARFYIQVWYERKRKIQGWRKLVTYH